MKRISLIITLLLAAALVWFFILKPPRKTEEEAVEEPPVMDVEDAQKDEVPEPPKPIQHPPRGFVPDWSSLDQYQETMTASEFRDKIENVYAVGDTWKEVIEIGDAEAVIQTGGDPFILRLLPEGAPVPGNIPRYWKNEGPLSSMHIVLDPGHIGGEYAGMEERQFGFPEDKPVREGEMTLLTAQLIKPMLEALGARVTLVRSSNTPVTREKPEYFFDLYRELNPGIPDERLKPWAERWFYRRSEITARAEIINDELKPDLVLCLHYNASSDSAHWVSPTQPVLVDENHFHLLLNGAFTVSEVLDEGERFQMVERILQRIHSREVALAKVLADVFVEQTGLPPYTYAPDSNRAKNVAGHPYLWARNLLANRAYTCPVIFYEPWCMNHKVVYKRAQLGDYEGVREIDGVEYPSLMREYARAVVDGLVKFDELNR